MPEDFLTFERPFGLEQHIFNGICYVISHTLAIYYSWLQYCGEVPNTFVYEMFSGYVGGMGITIGCHRYWTHRTFKATMPFQILMMICQTVSFQLPIRKWCLDHRLHHKFTDTNKDPHNSTRGFWYSHIGWLILPKHPELVKELKNFDVSDLDNDPVVRFQSKWYWSLTLTFFIIMPIIIQKGIWPEMTYFQCFASNMRRFVLSEQLTFCVNSFAHLWGTKPYDGSISSTQSPFVAFLTVGEGWHNYHHTFPWDYRASEFGWRINLSTIVIDFFALIGWAYDLKTASPELIKKRVLNIKKNAEKGIFTDSTLIETEMTYEDDPNKDDSLLTVASNSPAWVTYVTDEEKVVTKALVLAESLERVRSAITKVVFASHSLDGRLKEQLLQAFDLVIPTISSASLHFQLEEEALIHALNLKSFEKCVFLSPECLVLRNCDDLLKTKGFQGWCKSCGIYSILAHSKSLKKFLEAAQSGDKNRLHTWIRNHIKNISYFGVKYDVLLDLKRGATPCLERDAAIVTFADKHPLDNHDDDSTNNGSLELHAERVFRKIYEELEQNSSLELELEPRQGSGEPIVVVGMSCRLPGANNIDEFWNILSKGINTVRPVPPSRWGRNHSFIQSKDKTQSAGFLSTPIDEFDYKFFGISPREAELLDPQQRLLHEVTWEALEDATTLIFSGHMGNSVASPKRETNLALACGANLIIHPFEPMKQNIVLSPLGNVGHLMRKQMASQGLRGLSGGPRGVSKSMGTPTIQCEAKAMELALKDAGVDPEDVSFWKRMEPEHQWAYGGGRKTPLYIGSVKTNIGHTEAASGLAGLIKVILSMKNELIPAHLNFDKLNPEIKLDDIQAQIPVYPEPPVVNDEDSIKWKLERPLNILKLSAKCEESLEILIKKYEAILDLDSNAEFCDIAHTANIGRGNFPHRASIIARDSHEALSIIRGKNYKTNRSTAGGTKLCFLFTGQGSQYPNMAKELYDTSPVFQSHFQHCCSILKGFCETIDLFQLVFGSASNSETISQTLNSQISIFVVEYCLLKLWETWGVTPDYVLGHSLGEFAAAVAVGVLDLESALRLVTTRSILIDSLPQGSML
ncbi:Acyl-CoA Delta(11) desaturase, partial [Orchesella cincta]